MPRNDHGRELQWYAEGYPENHAEVWKNQTDAEILSNETAEHQKAGCENNVCVHEMR